MKSIQFWCRTTLAIGVGSLLFLSLSTPSNASQAGFHSVAAATPLFLQQQAGAQTVQPPGQSGATPRGTLPNSTLPVTLMHPSCSVENSTPTPVCSTLAGVQACTTQFGSARSCSSFGTEMDGIGSCSTIQRLTGCSVLQPSLSTDFGAVCSTISPGSGETSNCSTLTTQKKQACSTENPMGSSGFCSAWGSAGGEALCSVLAPGGTQRSFCSTFRPGGMRCSTLNASGADQSGGCSVQMGAKGVCTALKQASIGSCSIHSFPHHCSVINGPGPGPNGRCVQ